MKHLIWIALLAALVGGGYYGYERAGAKIGQEEVKRILEEHGMKAERQKAKYRDEKSRDQLRREMTPLLRAAGVSDPEAEVWVDLEDGVLSLGVVYTETLERPGGQSTSEEVQLSHEVKID
jgi:hypothetical protein